MPKEKIGHGYLYAGVEEKFPLCCIFFFQDVWSGENKKFFKEYCSTMSILTNNAGLILCPDCVTKKVTELSLHSELA